METIIECGGNRYLGQFMNDFPENVMVNKVLTGCGGTTVALANDIPYVICVPFRSMIINKMKWAKENNVNLCPVMSGITDSEILAYKGIKFLVTYDSLGRLCSLIQTSNYKILIDESHKLIDAGAFRGEAIRIVLENFKKFKSYVFITATPVKDKYQLPVLREIQKVKINWENIEPVEIRYTKDITNLNQYISLLAAKYLTGEIEGNAHIFINSVSSIIEIIETIHPSLAIPENINIICANNEENQYKLDCTLMNFTIKNVGDVNKVNFYTSTAFEGCDIFDLEGKIYIVTDGRKDYTKNDILTTLPQIIGRIRDSKYKNNIDLIFTPSPFQECTNEAEFEAFVKESLKYAEDAIESYQTTSNPMIKTAIYKDAETNKYILQRNDTLILNETAMYNEMHAFDSIHNTYYAFKSDFSNRSFTLDVNDSKHYYSQQYSTTIDGSDKILIQKKPSFEKLCKEYLSEGCTDLIRRRIDVFEPLIGKAVSKIGKDKLKALRYERKLIKDELIKIDSLSTMDWRIVKILNYREGRFISCQKIKEDLNYVYDQLKIPKMPKATDLRNWYGLESSFQRSKFSNKTERGYKIIACKIKIN